MRMSGTQSEPRELTSNELDEEIRDTLKRYIERKLGRKKFEAGGLNVILEGEIDSQDSNFASVVASYASMMPIE